MRTISAEQSIAIIPDGASLMIGGFMGVGTPERLIDELVRRKPRNLTVIANDTASPGRGIGKLVEARLLRKAIVSHIGLNPETQRQMMAGELEVELVPQGTLIERIRAGGHGLGGILTQTGIGTPVETGKQRIDLDGESYLLETALRADFALVQAFLADYLGNLSYALTARNFNPVIAMAADTVIVSADNIVPVGVLSPDHIVTPAPLVDSSLQIDEGSNGAADRHRASDRTGAVTGHAGESGHRDSNAGRKLRAGGNACVLPVRERADRHRLAARGRHGASDAD
jgi:acetate CoA/acetoacetate CoA-transferase alpha subunit